VTSTAVHETNLDYTPVRQGKVRDVYRAPTYLPGHLVVATTDRTSVFDEILKDSIPGKGRVLNALTRHFLPLLKEWVGVGNHLVDNEATRALISQVERDHRELAGMVSVWREVTPVLIEFIVRRHITGSLYREYKKGARNILGHQFPPGLADGALLLPRRRKATM